MLFRPGFYFDADDGGAGGAPPAPEPVVQAAAGTGTPQPDYKALYEQAQAEVKTLKSEEWHKRAIGWQQTYNDLKAKYDSDTSRLTVLDDEYKSTVAKLAEHENAVGVLRSELDQTKADLSNKSTKLERQEMIIREFPQLLPFMGSKKEDGTLEPDVLPDGTGDELRSKLNTFSSRVQIYGAAGAQMNLAGSSPGAPSGNKPDAVGDAWQKVLSAVRSGDTKEYDEAYSAFIAAKKITQ
jgi:hypothetical protein